MSDKSRKLPPVPWSTRVLAGLGFACAALAIFLMVSSQLALLDAQNYLRRRYRVNLDVPIKQIRPNLLSEPVASRRPLPPLGFCWTIELDTGSIQAELSVNPWTREIIDWNIEI